MRRLCVLVVCDGCECYLQAMFTSTVCPATDADTDTDTDADTDPTLPYSTTHTQQVATTASSE